MTDYTYAQLETLWINAGGPKSEAPVAAAIAMAESGGNSDDFNPHDSNGRGGTQVSAGLWQISNGTMTPPANWANPAANAQMAVAKWKHAGNKFTPWGSFGPCPGSAYCGFLSSKTTPDPNVPGSPTAHTAQTVAAGASDCLLGNPLGISLPLVGSISAGPACLFSRSNARAWIGAGLMLLGLPIAMSGLVVLGVAVGLKALGPLGKTAEGVGGVLMLVPGAEGVGAGIAAAGRAAKSPAKEGQRRGQARQRRAASEDREAEITLGEPRENPDLEVRGGTVRESEADRAARKRRENAAARARARRSAGQGRPASREEAGF